MPSQAEKRALLYGSPVALEYMNEYDEHFSVNEFVNEINCLKALQTYTDNECAFIFETRNY